jgi:hypothetical protein
VQLAEDAANGLKFLVGQCGDEIVLAPFTVEIEHINGPVVGYYQNTRR